MLQEATIEDLHRELAFFRNEWVSRLLCYLSSAGICQYNKILCSTNLLPIGSQAFGAL